MVVTMPEQVILHRHTGAMVPKPRPLAIRRAVAGEDGYRTPTIEDPEHPANSRNSTSPLAASRDYKDDRWRSCGRDPANDMEVPGDGSSEDTSNVKPRKLSWKQRMKHVTWAWFTLTMATGGIANVLHNGTGPWRSVMAPNILTRLQSRLDFTACTPWALCFSWPILSFTSPSGP